MKIAELIEQPSAQPPAADPRKRHQRMLLDHITAKQERQTRHIRRKHERSVIPITLL